MDEHPRSVCRPQREALEQCLEPRSSLGDVAARAPEPQQVHRKAEACIRVTVMLAPVECHAKVPELTLQATHLVTLAHTFEHRCTQLCKLEAIPGVAAPDSVRLVCRRQLLERKLAYGLEHHVPGLALLVLFQSEQAPVDQ